MTQPIQPQNIKMAATWNAGGQHYDRISLTIADSIEHCVNRLAPRSGERVLDVATGTGWTARRVAARGATVTGVDLGADLIDAANAAAAAATSTRFALRSASDKRSCRLSTPSSGSSSLVAQSVHCSMRASSCTAVGHNGL